MGFLSYGVVMPAPPAAGAPHASQDASYRRACATTTPLLSRRGLDNRSRATLASPPGRAGPEAAGVPACPWPRAAPRPGARAAGLRAGASVDTPLGGVGGAAWPGRSLRGRVASASAHQA